MMVVLAPVKDNNAGDCSGSKMTTMMMIMMMMTTTTTTYGHDDAHCSFHTYRLRSGSVKLSLLTAWL